MTLAWLVTVFLTSALAQETRSVRCFKGANDAGQLSPDQALRLCESANSLGPLDCFLKVRARSSIDQLLAVRLCRCADTTGPAECFIEARNRGFLADPQAVDLCARPDWQCTAAVWSSAYLGP